MLYRSPIRLLPLMLAAALLATGCKTVSEEIPPIVTQIQSTAVGTEADTLSAENVSETVGSTAETSETVTEVTKTEVVEAEQTAVTERAAEALSETEEITETTTETTETTSEITTCSSLGATPGRLQR